MANRIRTIFIYLLILVLLTGVLFGCSNEQITLEAPNNIRVENGELKWDKVDGADDYLLSINGNVIRIAGTSYNDLEPLVEYTISISSRNVWETSTPSPEIKGMILEPPTNFVYYDGRLYWDKKDNAVGYCVEMEGKTYSFPDIARTDFEIYEAGTKSAKIKSLGDGDYYFDSKYSEEVPVRISEILWDEIEIEKPTGKGNVSSPYYINNVGNMKWLVNLWQEDYIKLKDIYFEMQYDIDFRYVSGYVPIGTTEKPFLGKFNGKNHGIYYLNIEAENAAVFGCVGDGAEVTNVFTYGGSSNGINAAAGLVCCNIGYVGNCQNYNFVHGSTAGGIVAENTDSKMILSCINYGEITGENVGGISGWNYNGTIYQCENKGSVTALNNAGGVVATNAGNVFYSKNDAIVSGMNAGGITYINMGTIKSCCNFGHVTGLKYAAGISASNSGTIKYVYNVANIESTSTYKDRYVGGIVGYFSNGKLIMGYSLGQPFFGTETNRVPGELVGYYRSGLITNCYYLKDRLEPVANTNSFIGEGNIAVDLEDFCLESTLNIFNEKVDSEDVTLLSPKLFVAGDLCPAFFWE